MRFGPLAEETAADIVNTRSAEELQRIFQEYGEEHHAGRVARRIVEERQRLAIESTGRLAAIVAAAKPRERSRIHPATRVFQALRIAVNDELGAVERALPAALEMLRPGGRLGVISFHSLEDRVVKRFLRAQEHGCTCPPDFPVCVCGSQPTLRATPRRAIRPSAGEIARNPRSQSARLRVGTKVGD
jgi:16S rRNA (cytosine1402-N4)-methyltransferase